MAQIHPGQPFYGNQSGRARRRRLEAGRTCDRRLWSMTTDFRFESQALQRCSGPLNRGARGSTVATHQFQRKLNRTSAPGPPRKRIVLPTQNGEHDLRLPPLSCRLGRVAMHSFCKRDQTGAAPVVGSNSSPVAQSVERPTLNREVDGANPSGAATSSPRNRTASRAGRSLADRRTDIAEAGGAEPPRRTISQSSRSSMYRAPRFGRGGCRRNSCREHHLLFPA